MQEKEEKEKEKEEKKKGITLKRVRVYIYINKEINIVSLVIVNKASHSSGTARIYNRTHPPQRADLNLKLNQSVISDSHEVAADWLKSQPIKD